MGTITTRKDKSGQTRYRASIRINRKDMPTHSESKTFSQKSLATAWIKKREAEIELNPDILTIKQDITFKEACENFLTDVGHNFERSRNANIRQLSASILSDVKLSKLSKAHYNSYADSRLQVIKPQTLAGDMVDIRAVLKHAKIVGGYDVNLADFEDVVLALRYLRKIKGSDKRTRLPTSEELQALTTYFYKKFHAKTSAIPYHLLIWFAIYTGRRQDEICNLRLSDYHDGWWLVRDAKNPTGSKGNNIKVMVPEKAQKLIPLFLEYRDAQKTMLKNYDDDFLIPTTPKTLSARFTETCKVLGIKDLHFHDLRHECATRLAEEGLSIPQIQQVTGHQSWSSLQIYVNMQPRKNLLDYWEAIDVAKKSEVLVG